MTRGNVLVIGNSGVGKSTLINAVLGEDRAKTGWGIEGTTDELEIYEGDGLPFRIIDSIGFEPSFFKKMKAVNAVKKWSKSSAKEDGEDRKINVIWFCIDGTSSKLFPETIKNLSSATSMWESVPVIVVITKSYSVPERARNMEMVNNAFAKQKRYSKNLRKVIPVVASTYALNESAYAPPEGITELIDATNQLMPEGVKAAETDLYNFKLNRKRAMAQSLVGASVIAGAAAGAVPVLVADAVLLTSIEIAEVNGLAMIYGIDKSENSKKFFHSIIEGGTVSAAAKMTTNALKAVPGINLAASAVNAITAGSFVAAIGEGTIYAFEQVYMGKKTLEDVDWVKKVIEERISPELMERVIAAVGKIAGNADPKAIAKIVLDVFMQKK